MRPNSVRNSELWPSSVVISVFDCPISGLVSCFPESFEVCGEKIQESSGVIVSPDSNDDGLYDNNVNCHWTITVADDHVIRYTFTYFEVEYSEDCDKDVLWVCA